MSPEQRLLAEIFGELWKDKYLLDYCDMCGTFTISCEECKSSTCGGGGSCEKCKEDFAEFNEIDTSPISSKYLTKEEIETFRKIDHLKRLLQTNILAGFKEMNWQYLKESGEASEKDESYFPQLREFEYKPEVSHNQPAK